MIEWLIIKKILNGKKKKKSKLFVIISLILVLIFFWFILDDDSTEYYIKKQKSNNVSNEQKDTMDRKVIKVFSEDEVTKTGSGTGKGKSRNGSIDATTQEVLDAITSIVGSFDAQYIKNGINMTDSQVEFMKEIIPMAIMIHLKNPYMWTSTVMLQKICESGWGYSTPKDNVTGEDSHNCFGIKAAGHKPNEYWDGSAVNSTTKEAYDSGGYSIVDGFKKYDSVLNSFLDYGVYFFEENPRYRGGEGCSSLFGLTGAAADYRNATSGLDQVKIIQNAGYSPGSEDYYISMANSIYNGYNFARYDELGEKVAQALAQENGDTGFADDEWVPSGDTTWLDEIGIDSSKLSSKRLKVIQEGRLLYGVPYQLTDAALPPRNADGTYNFDRNMIYSLEYPKYHLDCSSFVQHCYRQIGIEITRTTTSQVASGTMTRIDPSAAKPGDLAYNASYGHVVMFLAFNADGTMKVQHCNQTWQSGNEGELPRGHVQYTANRYTSGHTFYRVNGMD